MKRLESIRRHCGMINRAWNAFGAALIAVALLTGADAWAQTSRTIRIVVPFPAGGSADILARLLSEHISKAEGPTVVIENRPSGGASIAYEAVARAAPDGNTLVINANSIAINPHLRKVNYDPLTSYEPSCYLLSSPQVIVVNSESPYRTLVEFIAAAHAKPGQLTFATVGPAITQHIGFEQFKRIANINVIYVPYPGGAPAMTAVLGGHVQAVLANYSEVQEQLQAGKVRALASTSQTRIAPLPRRTDDRGARLQKLQRRGLVRRDGTSKNAERYRRTACRLVQSSDQSAGGHSEASQARSLSGWHMPRRFRRAYPEQIRRIRSHYPRRGHQGRIVSMTPQCPLLRAKRTCGFALDMAAYGPKPTCLNAPHLPALGW